MHIIMKKTPDVITADPCCNQKTSLNTPIRVQEKNSELRFLYQNIDVQGVRIFHGSTTYQAVQLEKSCMISWLMARTAGQGHWHRLQSDGPRFQPELHPSQQCELGKNGLVVALQAVVAGKGPSQVLKSETRQVASSTSPGTQAVLNECWFCALPVPSL